MPRKWREEGDKKNNRDYDGRTTLREWEKNGEQEQKKDGMEDW